MDEVHSTSRARRRAPLIKLGGVTAGVTAAALALSACSSSSNSNSSAGGGGTSSGASGGGGGKKVGVSLILKTLTNPYFVSMAKDAKTSATQNNVDLTVAAGKTDGDTQTQIAAIDNAISRGDKGILITINGNAVNTEISKARQAGLYVIALDTAPTPPSIVDITYATDNEQAGKLIGQYGAAKLNGQKATIAMLDLFNTQVVSVDIQRDHGFLEGMGIDPGSKTENGKEAKSGHYTAGKGGDYQIACHQPTQGDIPHGKTAMENCLSANSNINVVYTINEPAADGAYQALQAAGKANDVTVLTIDGSCKYVKNYVGSKFAADSAQYPGKMASLGVESIAKLANGGTKPTTSNGLSFYNTGTNLVAKDALAGVTSQTPDEAAKACWGSG
jgi:fructose transport system substrate-binding protein